MAAIQPLLDQPDDQLPVLLAEVATRVARIPNIAPGPNAVTAEELQAALQASSAVILEAVHASEARVMAKINEESSLLMLRLHNSKCPYNTQLRYPAGIDSQYFPQNKIELYQIRGPACIQMAEALGMQPFPNNMNVESRREKIIEYLGAI
ncbi:hypothetical protein AN958_11919 [Leucoagaricus sp. SymC.cos]|nr:hypothetical protein AN958_11919 [Leucoagaricus sp. SymC.cos]